MIRPAWTGAYSAAVGLGAFLLFLIQPLAGKAILPRFGGAALVWTACLLFFQLALLAGYAWAHVGSRALGPSWTTPVHALLLLGACAVRIVPGADWRPEGGDAVATGVLGLLATTVGPACVLLAASGPLLQASFHRAFPDRSPYRLYAWSNLGSMLALVAYPFAIEPRLGLAEQQAAWMTAFRVFVGLCVVCLVLAHLAPHRAAALPSEPADAELARKAWLRWTAWAAAGVVLFMGLTNHLTMNVAAVPLLWVLPLAIYLASYIFAFAGGYRRRPFAVLLVPATIVVLVSTLAAAEYEVARRVDPGFALRTALLGASLFVLCTVCHGELYRLRPAPRHLTGFYLAIAAGGAAGGALVALVAPRVFLPDQELHLGLLLLVALFLYGRYTDRTSVLHRGRPRWAWALLLLGCAAAVAVPVVETRRLLAHAIEVRRSEYGLLRILHVGDGDVPPHRRLYHGVTLHGAQFLEESRRRQPTTYYTPAGGGGAVLARFRAGEPREIGVIGLGAGTLAVYGAPQDTWRYYEIDPDVVELARGSFTFLEDSPARQEVVLGDARLSLEREPDREFDVLIVDAFSSDAVPVHLLTVEAFEVYERHLAEGGVMAFHVSNRSLDLTPLLYGLAARNGFHALNVVTLEARPAHLVSRSDWMILSRDTAFLDELIAEFAPWKEREVIGLYVGDPQRYGAVRSWTDDYSNLLAVLR